MIGLVEGVRDDAALRELVGSQIRHRSHQVGRVLCDRATARGDAVRTEAAGTVLDVAFARLFTQTLFSGTTPGTADREHLVDAVLLPLLRPDAEHRGRWLDHHAPSTGAPAVPGRPPDGGR